MTSFGKLTGIALLVGAGLFAQELVKNGGFGEGNTIPGTLPEGWSVLDKNGAQWEYIDYDGATDARAICIRAEKQGKTGKAGQVVACMPATEYTLRADFKSEGIVPKVAVLGKNGDALATLESDSPEWKAKSATFKTTDEKELSIVVSANDGKGYAAVDNVSVSKAAEKASAYGENLALGKTYTFSTKPNYNLCTDDGDTTQLTDGQYTKGYFWTQKSTVGWKEGNGFQHITIDLGKVCPIGGFSLNTAYAVPATVPPPNAINIFVSDDGKEWHLAGELVSSCQKRNGTPDLSKYAIYRLHAEMPCKGRYVAFQLLFTNYFFTDEIEIYKGDDSLLDKPMKGNAITDIKSHRFDSIVIAAIRDEISRLQKKFDSPKTASFAEEAEKFYEEVGGLVFADVREMTPLYPVCKEHEDIFALNAKYLRSKGLKNPVLWRNCRWDNLDVIEEPPKGAAEPIVVEMMRGEVRSATVNLMNPTDKALEFKVSVEELPKGSGIDCREVLSMLTTQGVCTSSALKAGDGASVNVKAIPGMNRQIWLSFNRPTLKAGTYKAKVTAIADGVKLYIPLKLVIYDFDFPKPRLHVGGWDYLHVPKGGGNMFGLQPNPERGRDMMRDIYVDSPWSSNTPWNGAMVGPQGAKFDAEGHLVNADTLDYSTWENWIKFWDNARLYCVYLCVGKIFNGEKMGTPRFDTMVKEYFAAWADYLRKKDFPTEKVVLLIIDEPWDRDKDETFIAWAKPIIAAKTGFRLFEDPIHPDYRKALPEVYSMSDIICPNRPSILNNADPAAYKAFLHKYKEQGKELWLYSCSGPSRLLDPVSYYRAQAWEAFEMDAKGTFFWAFGCGGGINDSWRPFKQTQLEFCPYFVSPDNSTMPAKQSEAIRESVQDYEYLCMLKDRVEELRKAGKGGRKLADAEALLKDAPKRALNTKKTEGAVSWSNKSGLNWRDAKDRSVIDEEAVKVLRMLNSLK